MLGRSLLQGRHYRRESAETKRIDPMKSVKLGDVVRYVRVVDPGDEECQFVVIEDNGDRLMIG
jgi:hypothetical protein